MIFDEEDKEHKKVQSVNYAPNFSRLKLPNAYGEQISSCEIADEDIEDSHVAMPVSREVRK